MDKSSKQTFGMKMGDWFRHILSCCDARGEEEEERPALQISGPTDFRREDISIPGLDAEHQRWIREKAIQDAGRMFENLQPLRSSPSGHFADREHHPTTATKLPTYEQFTTPRPPSPNPNTSTPPSTYHYTSPLDRVRAHTRKISNSLGVTKPLGYQSVAGGGSPYEMRSLMDPSVGSRTQMVGAEGGSPGKMSGESYSVAGSEEERDSAKGGLGLRF